MKKRIALLCASTVIFFTSTAFSQILVDWDIDGTQGFPFTSPLVTGTAPGSTDFISGLLDPTATTLSRGPGLNNDGPFTLGPDFFAAKGWWDGSPIDWTDLTSAGVANGAYFSINLALDPLSMADGLYLRKVSVDLSRGFGDFGGPRKWDVVLVNNDSGDIIGGDKFASFELPADPLVNTLNPYMLDVSGVNWQGLMASSVSIQLWGYDNQTLANGYAAIGDDNDPGGRTWDVQVEGGVIPEPSTYALIFGGFALGIVIFRRRLGNKEVSEEAAAA